jgi:hypothetical protein
MPAGGRSSRSDQPKGEYHVQKKLTLSKETLRVLDDGDLAAVMGGHAPPHAQTGRKNKCKRSSGKGKGCKK